MHLNQALTIQGMVIIRCDVSYSRLLSLNQNEAATQVLVSRCLFVLWRSRAGLWQLLLRPAMPKRRRACARASSTGNHIDISLCDNLYHRLDEHIQGTRYGEHSLGCYRVCIKALEERTKLYASTRTHKAIRSALLSSLKRLTSLSNGLTG